MSYMAGSRLPCVLVNVMRGGPGLGSIGAAQGDYFQATKGHGHGDYHVPVLAPSSIARGDRARGRRVRPRGALPDAGDDPRRRHPGPGDGAGPAGLPHPAPPGAGLGHRGRRGPRAAVLRSLHLRARGPRGAQPRPPGEVPRDHGRARRAGPASASTTPRSCSSPTARPPGSRAPPWSGRARRASGRPLPADHPVAVPGRRPARRPPAARAPSSSSSCRPARWSRTSGSRWRGPSRSCSTAGRAAWSRRPDEVVAAARRAWSVTEPATRGGPHAMPDGGDR